MTATHISCAGPVALLIALYNGKTQAEAVATDPQAVFRELELEEHLTHAAPPTASRSMVERIRKDKEAMLAATRQSTFSPASGPT